MTTIDEYFGECGGHHAANSKRVMKPLHDPETDEPFDFSEIARFNPKRVPLPGQAHVITAMVKGLRRDSGGFNGGEMGVGKSIMAAITAWKFLNGKGRVILMVPDHTIDKWCDEIRTTIPNANVISFDKWTEVIHYYWSIADFSVSGVKRWLEPTGIDFVVMGRDQSKYLPTCPNMGEPKMCFDGKVREFGGSSKRVVGWEIMTDDHNNRIWDDDKGGWKRKPKIARIYRCPSCGHRLIDPKKGTPIDVAKSSSGIRCEGRIGVQIIDSDSTHCGKDKILLGSEYATAPEGKLIKQGDRKYRVKVCGEPLWNYVRKPNRWAPAMFIHSKMRGAFDLCIVDEVHEEKSDSSAQALAAGKLMAASKRVLAMTGTLIGGYAWHLFPTLMRIAPGPLRREGIKWGQKTEFSKKYGRVDRIVTVTQEDDSGSSRGRRSTSMRRIRNGRQSERTAIAPGVMPNLYARHLARCSAFLDMLDLADHMPPLAEYIGCDPASEHLVRNPKDPFWINTAVEMSPEQAMETERITEICKAANNELVKRGSMRFLSAMLYTTMEYPDHPFDWTSDFEDDGDSIPALLGQSFLSQFKHSFHPESESLMLVREVEVGPPEIDHVPLVKDRGVYSVDVTFNGKATRQLIYDTGASSISLSKAMAREIGLSAKPGDYDGASQIADGSIVPCRITRIDEVKVGRFAVTNVEASIKSNAPHSVGYWAKPGLKTRENWVGVVTPRDLPKDVVYPKEQRLVDICKAEKAAGNQVWVYVNMTGKRDVQPRLAKILEEAGLKVGILRAKAVKPRDRMAWMEKQGRDFDVIISHPRPVMTGLDFVSKKPGGFNYNSIVFYQTGTQAFVCKQASRRAWRLIQKKKCRVYYLYYRHTMQHHFVSHMAKKFAAMSAIAGDFSMDGLIAMGGSDDGALALCKSIGSNIDDTLLRANWDKAHGSYGMEEDEALEGVVVGGENLCPILSPVGGDNACGITEEDLAEWAEAESMSQPEPELVPATACEDEAETEQALSISDEHDKDFDDILEESEVEMEWFNLTEEELEALNL